jgi:hypothetical protein
MKTLWDCHHNIPRRDVLVAVVMSAKTAVSTQPTGQTGRILAVDVPIAGHGIEAVVVRLNLGES